ncbi:MAG: PDZ domain-containing protein [Chloroflexi bacterium]|jgi:carboxyl-terminal processing protease|nr:PDZ domain-containing protein [Chloroflexota bacterium]
MKSHLSALFIGIAALLVGFNAGYLLGQSPIAPFNVFPATFLSQEDSEAFEPLWEVHDLVQTRYFDQPVDENILAEGAINGMLAALDDPHTRYLSPQDEIAEREGFAGEIQGIGVEVTTEDGNITVVSPIDGTPAHAAGLRPGDILRQADGVELTDMSVMEAAQLIRGPVGTAVALLIERDGETFTVDITRAVIEIDSVRGEILEDDLAYVRLSHFGTRTTEELQEVLSELLAEEPAGMILDLRRNPGGGLGTVVDIADEFLPEGTVLIQEFANGVEREYNATNKGNAEELPLVVLIDEGSASASEVLAGAIQDRKRGVLIGQTSFGKGTVQTWQELSNGGGVRITFARWLTPDELWVHEEGLQPDIAVQLPEFEEGVEFNDTQLQAAIDYLLGNQVIDEESSASDT